MKKLIFCLFLFGGMFGVVSSAFAQNATLFFTPTSGSFSPGQTFRVSVNVDTKSANVNAVAAYFTYPADKLDALAVDTTGSAMTLFAEQAAGGGRVDISGGKPTPGFSGVQKIASVDFRVKTGASGSALLQFAPDAAVLSDTTNQNILSLPSSGTATFQIGQATTPTPVPTPGTPPPVVPTPTPGPSPTPTPTPSAQDILQISNVRAEQVGPNSIRISWQTNKASLARVDYGVSGAYESSVLVGKSGQDHSVLVTDLAEQGEYQFQVKSVTETGEIALLEGLSLEDLAQGEGEKITIRQNPDELSIGGFQVTNTSLLLFVGLPVIVFLVIAFLVIRRIRSRAE